MGMERWVGRGGPAAQQLAARQPPLDLTGREAGREQLATRHDAVLPAREPRHPRRCRGASTTHVVV
jgi:hypothetical protein